MDGVFSGAVCHRPLPLPPLTGHRRPPAQPRSTSALTGPSPHRLIPALRSTSATAPSLRSHTGRRRPLAQPRPVSSPATVSPHDLLTETRSSIEQVAARILAIKRDGAPKSDLRELVTQMSLLIITLTLRQVNREILMEEDKVKRETEAAKAPVDTTTLQLHNLLYEKNHYVKAIRACQDFQTKYPGIELGPVEEFHCTAPADIREKTLAADATHDLMLKRLNFELVQIGNCYPLAATQWELCLSPSC